MKYVFIAFLISIASSAYALETMKGAELYSWKDAKGTVWFSLLPGTNRNKRSQELFNSKIDAKELLGELSKLPPGTFLSWNSSISLHDPNSVKFAMPAKNLEADIRRKIKDRNLDLH